MNVVVLRGVLSGPPTIRSLASGSVLCALDVTTRDATGAAATVPVAWFDPVEVPAWPAGAEVVVTGVVRRRFFRAGGLTQSRTEVVADAVVPASSTRTARRVVERAAAALAEEVPAKAGRVRSPRGA